MINVVAFFQQNAGAVTTAGVLIGFGYLASKNETKVAIVAAENDKKVAVLVAENKALAAENQALAAENDKKVAVLAAENKAVAAESERKLMEMILDLGFSYEYKRFVTMKTQEMRLGAAGVDDIETES